MLLLLGIVLWLWFYYGRLYGGGPTFLQSYNPQLTLPNAFRLSASNQGAFAAKFKCMHWT